MVRDLSMPFGGVKVAIFSFVVMKTYVQLQESGTGRESAADSLRFFTEAKTICTKFA